MIQEVRFHREKNARCVGQDTLQNIVLVMANNNRPEGIPYLFIVLENVAELIFFYRSYFAIHHQRNIERNWNTSRCWAV